MRILHVTDFHFHEPWFRWLSAEVEKYDACCFTGDLIDSFPNAAVGLHQQARWILDWLREFPKPMFVCTGNHDHWPEQGSKRDPDANGRWLEKAARTGIAIDGSLTRLGTVNFMSLPWAFESRVAVTTPIILLSHAAPLGTSVGLSLEGDMGDPELADVVAKLPQGSLVLSGHVHEPKRWHDRIGSVWCFNPGVDSNAETPNYVAIDTTAGLAIHFGWGHESDPLRLNWPQDHNASEKSWTMDALANRIHSAFEQHFEQTSTEPTAFESAIMSDDEGKHSWSRKGDRTADAIADAVEMKEGIAEDIQLILADQYFDVEQARMGEETPYATDCHYEKKATDDVEFQSEWDQFERDLKTTVRYFSSSAHAILGRVFEGVDRHKTHAGHNVVVEAGPGKDITSLIRARVFQSGQGLRKAIMRPDLEVGPPPAECAVAGRMNAVGISVFYGAKDVNTAISEVRPPVGSDVVTGRFDLLRSVRLLDVEALREVFVEGSIFDPGYLRRLERAKFLGSLSRQIAKAVLPQDEYSGYLITQVIADYLANIVKLDGILYRSIQAGEATANVVLFHHAARAETMAIPAEAQLDASLYLSTEDGYEVDYTVWEKVPELPRKRKKLKPSLGHGPAALLDGSSTDFLADIRMPTLKLDPLSVQVHHVTGATFATQSHAVSRHRIELPKIGAKPDF